MKEFYFQDDRSILIFTIIYTVSDGCEHLLKC